MPFFMSSPSLPSHPPSHLHIPTPCAFLCLPLSSQFIPFPPNSSPFYLFGNQATWGWYELIPNSSERDQGSSGESHISTFVVFKEVKGAGSGTMLHWDMLVVFSIGCKTCPRLPKCPSTSSIKLDWLYIAILNKKRKRKEKTLPSNFLFHFCLPLLFLDASKLGKEKWSWP